MKLSKEGKIGVISLGIGIGLILIGIISNDVGVLSNFIILSTFIVATPQLLSMYKKFRELKEMEERFPSFLRDLTESIRSGIPFHIGIVSSSKLEYGKLSKEIKKMANQISWGTPLGKALNQFAERVRRSKRLFTAINTIRESQLSGGDTASTLESVADNCMILQESEKERRSMLSQYVLMMYAISIIFIVIVVAINKLLIPVFQSTSGIAGETLGLVNPCSSCYGISCMICGMFDSVASMFSITPGTIAAYYTPLFFFMSLVQSIFAGMVAGQISENSVVAGVKHSLILAGITFGAFGILVRTGILVG